MCATRWKKVENCWCRACLIYTIKFFTKFFHCFPPCPCRTMDNALRNFSLNISQALPEGTRVLHLSQRHSLRLLRHLHHKWNASVWPPSWPGRCIVVLFDAGGTVHQLGTSRTQKPSALCQCWEKGYSGAHPQENQEPGSIIWKDHGPVGTGSQDWGHLSPGEESSGC